MKAFYINAEEKSIHEVRYHGTLEDMETYLPYKYWELPSPVSAHDFLCIGQQSDFTGEQHYFITEGKHIYGNALIIGSLSDDEIPEGQTNPLIDCFLTMEQVEANIAFPSTTEVVPARKGVREIAPGIYGLSMDNIEEVHDFLKQIIGD